MSIKQHIIITDDNPRDREFLIQTLEAFDITETSNAEQAIAAVMTLDEPNIISDIQMPEINGIQMAERIWQHKPNARIIFWSNYSDEMYLRSLVDIIPPDTVYGYVLKTNKADVLLQATDEVFSQQHCWIDPGIKKIQKRAQQAGLTDAEYEVLIDIALGLTDKGIGLRRYLSRRGAQNRLKALYHKLEIDMNLPFDNEKQHVINLRSRAVCLALSRGLINLPILEEENTKLQNWMNYERLSIN